VFFLFQQKALLILQQLLIFISQTEIFLKKSDEKTPFNGHKLIT